MTDSEAAKKYGMGGAVVASLLEPYFYNYNFIMQLIDEILEVHRTDRTAPGSHRTVLAARSGTQLHLPVKVLKDGKSIRSNCTICCSNGKRKATDFKCTG